MVASKVVNDETHIYIASTFALSQPRLVGVLPLASKVMNATMLWTHNEDAFMIWRVAQTGKRTHLASVIGISGRVYAPLVNLNISADDVLNMAEGRDYAFFANYPMHNVVKFDYLTFNVTTVAIGNWFEGAPVSTPTSGTYLFTHFAHVGDVLYFSQHDRVFSIRPQTMTFVSRLHAAVTTAHLLTMQQDNPMGTNVFYADEDGNVGKMVGSAQTKSTLQKYMGQFLSSGLTVISGQLYVDGEKKLSSIDVLTGRVQWETAGSLTGETSAVSLHKQVYLLQVYGRVVSVKNVTTGAAIKSLYMDFDYGPGGTKFYYDGDSTYFTTGSPVVWRVTAGLALEHTAVVAGGKGKITSIVLGAYNIYFTDGAGGVYRVQKSQFKQNYTTEPNYEVHIPKLLPSAITMGPELVDGDLILNTNYGDVIAVDSLSGKLMFMSSEIGLFSEGPWKCGSTITCFCARNGLVVRLSKTATGFYLLTSYQLEDHDLPNPVLFGDRFIFAHSHGLTAVSYGPSAAVQWRYNLNVNYGAGCSHPVVQGGVLFAGCSGDLLSFRASDGTPMARTANMQLVEKTAGVVKNVAVVQTTGLPANIEGLVFPV